MRKLGPTPTRAQALARRAQLWPPPHASKLLRTPSLLDGRPLVDYIEHNRQRQQRSGR